MGNSKYHTSEGLGALICGILGIVLLFIINFVPFILAIIAIALGVSARKKGDIYGTIGLILGIVTIILTIVVSALVYYYVLSIF